ncbi:MAG: heparinase II/III family protein, partial [Brachybacterium sp.]|nr:heparinase II/III family protein [Brachybacterium sp.]
MSDGVRALHLCQAAPMVASRSPELQDWLEQAIRTHAEHLADPANMGNANHALHQQESLFVCGRVLKDEALWRLAMERMGALLRQQYDEQGMNAEGAIAYHHNNYLWWERTLRRMDVEGVPRPDGADRHLHAPEAIAHATRPDGTYVTIGDTDHMTPEVLDTPVTNYVGSGGQEGAAPAETVAVYDAGYVFGRSGWGDEQRPYRDHTFYSLRFGPSRRVHGHPDGTSVTYSGDGVNWVVDPGKYDYSKSPARMHVVSRAAHSLVSIEGKKPSKDAHVELISRTITDRYHEYVLADPSFPRVDLRRRVVYSVRGEYLVVIDEVRASRSVQAVQRWQLGPDVTASEDGTQVQLEAGTRREVLAFLDEPGPVETVREQEQPFDGWVATGLKSMAPATAVSVRGEGKALRFATVLATGRGQTPRVTSVPVSADGDPSQADTLRLDVTTGSSTERIDITPTGVTFPDVPDQRA